MVTQLQPDTSRWWWINPAIWSKHDNADTVNRPTETAAIVTVLALVTVIRLRLPMHGFAQYKRLLEVDIRERARFRRTHGDEWTELDEQAYMAHLAEQTGHFKTVKGKRQPDVTALMLLLRRTDDIVELLETYESGGYSADWRTSERDSGRGYARRAA